MFGIKNIFCCRMVLDDSNNEDDNVDDDDDYCSKDDGVRLTKLNVEYVTQPILHIECLNVCFL